MNKLSFYFISFIVLALIISCNKEVKLKAEGIYEKIDLFTLVYNRPLISFQIDSEGKVLEFEKSKDRIKIYGYVLCRTELDDLKDYLKGVYKSNDSIRTIKNGCVDGFSYNLTIETKSKIYDVGNTICDKKTIADEMVLFILTISENRDKELLFKNYMKYDKIQSGFDSILNQKN